MWRANAAALARAGASRVLGVLGKLGCGAPGSLVGNALAVTVPGEHRHE